MLTEKYKPDNLNEFTGNPSAVKTIDDWIKNWKNEDNALLVHGPPGIGKTTLMQILAKTLNYTLVETDASDQRSAGELKAQFSSALQQQSLFFKGKLVVFDEIDGLSAGDRGGANEMLNLIKTSKYPVILIANDAYIPKLRALRKYCKLVKFTKVHYNSIEKILSKIAKGEKIKVEDKALTSIARGADGDIKAAINDFELLSKGKKELAVKDITEIGYRDIERSIFDALKIIFKTESVETANQAMNNINKAPDEIIQWIRENLPYEYTKHDDLSKAYERLSKANLFMGRITRKQYWRYLSYASQLMSAGVALSKKERYTKFVMYKYPSKIIQMSRTKAMRAEEKEIAAELGKNLHCSRKTAKQYFPLLDLIQKKQPKVWKEMSSTLNISA